MPATALHHISLSTVGGTAVGFMLLRDKYGTPIWAPAHYRTIPGRQMSDSEYGFAQFPAEVALVWHEDNWWHGIGGINRKDNDDSTRFFLTYGYKVDTSEKSKIKLARQLETAASGDTTYDLCDANPSQYVPSGFAKSGAQMWAFIGDYAYTWDLTNKNWDRGTSYAGTTGPRMFRNGVEYVGSVYVPSWADDVGSGGLYTASDEPQRYLYKTLAATSWTQKAVSVTHPAYCKFFAVANSKLIMGYIGDSAANTTQNVGGGIDATQTTYTVADASGLVAGDVVEQENELNLITNVNVNTLTVVRGYRGSVGATHAQATAVNKITLNKNQIRTSTDGTTWSSATNIGNASSPIVAMVGLDWDTASYLYVFKTDGVYNYDFTNVNKISTIGGPTNGRASCVWQGYVYFSRSGGGLLQLDPDTDNIVDVSFSSVLPQRTELHGEVVALQATPDVLYALVQSVADLGYYLLEGRQVDGNVNISWQVVGFASYFAVTDANHAALYHDTVPNGTGNRDRIQVGMNSTFLTLLPYHYLRSADEDTVYSPDDDSYDISIEQDYGLANVTKRWHKVVFATDNLGTGGTDHYMAAQYSLDGAAYAWFTNTMGGTASQANSKIAADSVTLYFPAGVDGKRCSIKKFYYQGTTTTTGPELLSMTATVQLRPDSVNMFQLYLDIRDGLRLLNGTPENNCVGLMSSLRTWKDQADEIVLVDMEAGTRRVVLMKERYEERLVKVTSTGRMWYAVKCLAVQVS